MSIDEIKQLQRKIKTLEKENEKLRNALAPFACLGLSALRLGDFNRAKRAMNIKQEQCQ